MNSDDLETVVLVHGLGGSRLDMWRLARGLKRAGFHVVNWSYSSVRTTIDTHARRLAEKIRDLQESESVGTIHLVGHSMGGIIIRAMLAQIPLNQTWTKLGRMVMLASPNRGSHVATHCAPWLGWLAPSLLQISDVKDSYVNCLPNSPQQARLEFGVIEATKDRVIRPECIQLDGQADFAQVDGQHGLLTWYPETIRLVETFLRHGKFTETMRN